MCAGRLGEAGLGAVRYVSCASESIATFSGRSAATAAVSAAAATVELATSLAPAAFPRRIPDTSDVSTAARFAKRISPLYTPGVPASTSARTTVLL